jgi:hypothetical protein
VSLDLYKKLYPKQEKDRAGKPVSKCPECGKTLASRGIGEVSYCSLMCETNYRYRKRREDPSTGMKPSPGQAKKI